jgi:tetratricopeptide (TPR) repeat protein
MIKLPAYFKDPRYRQERVLWAVGLPLTAVILAGIAWAFLSPPAPAASKPTADDTFHPLPPTPTPVPDVAAERIAAALLAFQSGDIAASAKSLEGVDLAKAGSAPAWELAGILKESAGDKRAAMEIYSAGIAGNPSAGLHYRRAILLRNEGNLDRALEDMESATSHTTVHPLLVNERLLLLIQMGRKDRAREEMKVLADRAADPAGWIFARCGLALDDGDYAEGARLLTLAKNSSQPAVFHQLLGNPVLSRHQSRRELLPFYFSNISP